MRRRSENTADRESGTDEQAEENSISKLNPIQVIGRIFDQTVYMKEPELNKKMMDLVNRFVSDIPFHLLKCDISEEAVNLAYNTMKTRKI